MSFGRAVELASRLREPTGGGQSEQERKSSHNVGVGAPCVSELRDGVKISNAAQRVDANTWRRELTRHRMPRGAPSLYHVVTFVPQHRVPLLGEK